MILSVCLNPSVDVALTLSQFKIGDINRTDDVVRVAGGKGNNVARVVKTLDNESQVLAPIGGSDGQFIKNEMNRLKIDGSFPSLIEATRRCIAIIHDNNITEVRELGPTITIAEYDNILSEYKKLVVKSSLVVASGSLPLGMPKKAYADLIKIAKQYNKPFFLDAKGQALAEGIKEKPFLIKINNEELTEYSGIKLETKYDFISALQKINTLGIEVAIVSLGDKGLLASWRNELFEIAVPNVKVKSTVGCGDATMAGLAVAYNKKFSPKECLIWGASAGTSAAMEAATGVINLDNFMSIKGKIKVMSMIN